MTDFHAPKYSRALDFAQAQVAATIARTGDFFPSYSEQGVWKHDGALWTDWTGGFFTGLMWLFYKRTGDLEWRARAEHYSRLLERGSSIARCTIWASCFSTRIGRGTK